MQLPWKTVKDVLIAALNARFIELEASSRAWPCDYPEAGAVVLKVTSGVSGNAPVEAPGTLGAPLSGPRALVASAELEPSQLQDLSDLLPALLQVKTRAGLPLRLRVQLELGDGAEPPSQDVVVQINEILEKLKDGFRLE